jgi:bacteriocin-like protein
MTTATNSTATSRQVLEPAFELTDNELACVSGGTGKEPFLQFKMDSTMIGPSGGGGTDTEPFLQFKMNSTTIGN